MPSKYFANKIANNGTAKISASSGFKIFITAVTCSDSSTATTLTFADDSDLGVLEVTKNAGFVGFNPPIMCSSFTPSDTDISVVYYEAKAPY